MGDVADQDWVFTGSHRDQARLEVRERLDRVTTPQDVLPTPESDAGHRVQHRPDGKVLELPELRQIESAGRILEE